MSEENVIEPSEVEEPKVKQEYKTKGGDKAQQKRFPQKRNAGGGTGHRQTEDQSHLPPSERKFTQRCRLFIGNLTTDITEEELQEMFQTYGEVSELYLNADKGFAFVRLDLRRNAELAKTELDGTRKNGQTLRVRFATHGAALKVRYLSPHVSNELLEKAFSQFGSVERAIVIVDDRGKSTGEGIVEFARKPGAGTAMKQINEGCFLLSSSLQPILVEPLEQKDEEDGLPEKTMSRNKSFDRDRELPPRFASVGTFDYEFASRWKKLYEMERIQKDNLDKQVKEAQQKLKDEMMNSLQDHKAMVMRQELMRRQEELRRIEEVRQKRQDNMRRGPDGGGMGFGNMGNMMGMMNPDEHRMGGGGGMMGGGRSTMGGGGPPPQNNLLSNVISCCG